MVWLDDDSQENSNFRPHITADVFKRAFSNVIRANPLIIQ